VRHERNSCLSFKRKKVIKKIDPGYTQATQDTYHHYSKIRMKLKLILEVRSASFSNVAEFK
jgi:hypothetical protein